MKEWGPAGLMTSSSAGHDPYVAPQRISTIIRTFLAKIFVGLFFFGNDHDENLENLLLSQQ